MLRARVYLFLFWLAAASGGNQLSANALDAGDENEGGASEMPAAVPSPPLSPEHRELGPSWMKWGVEYHGRLERPTAVDFEADRDALVYLNRIRLWAGMEATDWLRFYVQGQDARAAGLRDPDDADSTIHHLDFHQAYVDFGRAKGTWGVRAGRQELAFGDERLVGADNYWNPLGQTFDAVRVTYQRPGLRVDTFGAFLVEPTCQSLARPSTGNQLAGLYASFDHGPRGAVIEPYLFWNSVRRMYDGVGPPEDRDVFTYGARTAGPLPARFDYNVEMAWQGGHRAAESIRAWAGHWELGVRPLRSDFGPRLGAEYNFATGDSRPGDGRHTTFDDLYPAGYNKYGMADPFAWRNIRNISGGVDWTLSKRWRLGVGYRSFWLASIYDGLYTEGDWCLTRNPSAASDHVGNQASMMATWELSDRWKFHAGYARFFPGQYLADSSFRGSLSTPFLMVDYSFQ